jgi:DnaJ-domain-containing protein 1
MSGPARIGRNERERRRDAEAARLRALRFTYEQIADQLGYADHSGARKAAERGRDRAVREPHQDMVLMDLAELDEMARQAWKVLHATHYVVDRGEVVTLHGEPLRDDAPVLAAIAKLLDIQQRRAKLVGLDAPTKMQATVTHATSDLDAAVAELAAEMALRDQAEAGT